ncbi:TonB-dependent receptor domain-containing protein [Sphingosinicella rhizophila]|uniref:TonB-dependent receptor n=1 Tax=Sphingosinicella rhizophila TaxID=3050082 RepID=A0ABU3QBY2_9SPHN|nr:TonB-dependent receptor [Sphingosinicella sp. GR2756]MDT9600508.1 TonB-dependent receptor [Sphingosinicella sp. GR2756]
MSGGDGPSYDDSLPLTSPVKRVNVFGRISYDLTDSIEISGDMRYSNVTTHHGFVPDLALQVISPDNAFLPAAVRNQLTGPFTLGRFNDDFGLIELDVKRENIQGTVAIEGGLGNGWRWDAYYSHGEQRNISGFENLRIASNYAEAVDSVINPLTGQPICRSALTVPTTACIPINLFGEGAPSDAALRYVLGDALTSTTAKLDVGAVSLRGEPFSIWAGPVSVAIGVEARREASDTLIDDLSKSKRWASLILAEEGGAFSVKEAFGEVVIPLLRDVPGFQLLEFNGAARISDYSTSGSIWSWKLGISNQVFDGLRLRAVRSRDIRSPNIAELFTAAALGVGNVFDPFTNQTVQVQRITGGNANLEPERADTYTIGMVFEPSFVPGLSLSADYYNIDVAGAITTLSTQDIVTRCFEGNDALCSQIVRNGQGQITQIFATYINLTTFKTSGVDLELAYRMPMEKIASSLPGRLNFRVLASYVDKLVNDDGVTRVDTIGNVGSNGVPKWRGFARMSYENEDLTLDLRTRYVGGGKYNAQQNIVNNDISSRLYVDLGIQYRLPLDGSGSRFTLFGNISNLFDRDPPILPNAAFYDVVGRYFTIGGRVNF